MSWLSNLGHAVMSVISGQAPNTTIIPGASTPVEQAINATVASAAGTAEGVVSTVKQEAATTVTGFLTNSMGAVPAEIAEAGLQALAATAISQMQGSSNKTEAEIATALHTFLTDFGVLPGAPPAPAAAVVEPASAA